MNDANSATPFLTLSNVSYDIEQTPLISDINLTIMADDMISLIGPNGAGKSTLVKLMLGLLTPSSGTITRKDGLIIGYVPQKFSVPTILPLRVVDLLKQVNPHRLVETEKEQLLTALSIQPLLNKQMVHLSGGETQRVLLAQALLEKPDLLILDEPMQGLDPETEELLYQFIDELPEFLRCAMLVISHDLHWVMRGSRHVICLNKHVCCEGQPVDIQSMEEFQQMFGLFDSTLLDSTLLDKTLLNEHKYEKPYVHNHDQCHHFLQT